MQSGLASARLVKAHAVCWQNGALIGTLNKITLLALATKTLHIENCKALIGFFLNASKHINSAPLPNNTMLGGTGTADT